MSEESVTEIGEGKERQDLIRRTGLGIKLAYYEPDEDVLLAAHSRKNSVILMRVAGEIAMWKLNKGSKSEREVMAAGLRESLVRDGLGKVDKNS